MPKVTRILALLVLCMMTQIPCIAYADELPQSDVLIFISFSMPKDSIKGWMNEAKKIHAPVVIRGLVSNSFKETLKRMAELVGDNQGGLQLDPVLFRRFQINKVPAVVVRGRDDFDVVYGDTHLDYALKGVIKRKDSLSSHAQHALDNLKGGHYA